MHKKRRTNQKQRCKNFHVTNEKMHVCKIFKCTSQGQQNSTHHKKKTKLQIKREHWKRWHSGQQYPEVNFIFTRKTQAPTGRLLTDKSLNRLFTIYSRPPNRPQDKPFAPFLCRGLWPWSQGFICSSYLTKVRSLPYLAVAPSLLLNSVRIRFVKVVTLISLSC